MENTHTHTHTQTYIIKPPKPSVMYDMFEVIKGIGVKEVDEENYRLIPENADVIFFSYFTVKNSDRPLPRWNVWYINTESLYVKRWLKRFNKINQFVNIQKISDYSYKNIYKFKTFMPKTVKYNIFAAMYDPYYIVGTQIQTRDIDILFFGALNDRREQIKNELEEKLINKKILFINNFKETMDYSFRSKMVLVIHFYKECNPIDFYRINKLICNKIPIIHEEVQQEEKESEEYKLLSKYLVFTSASDIPSTCDYYLRNYDDLIDKTDRLFSVFKEKFSMENKRLS